MTAPDPGPAPDRAAWFRNLREDCGQEVHEWVRCRQCTFTGPCCCAGGPCCKREMGEIDDD